jgi:hypothetical protein
MYAASGTAGLTEQWFTNETYTCKVERFEGADTKANLTTHTFTDTNANPTTHTFVDTFTDTSANPTTHTVHVRCVQRVLPVHPTKHELKGQANP